MCVCVCVMSQLIRGRVLRHKCLHCPEVFTDGYFTRVLVDNLNICDELRWWSVDIRDMAVICDCRQALGNRPLQFYLEQERVCVYHSVFEVCV